jgi:hypothetical protein
MDGRGRTDDRADSPADTLGFFAYRNAGSVRRRVADARVHVLASRAGVATLGAEWTSERQRGRDSSNYDLQEHTFSARRATRALYAQWVGEAGALRGSAGARRQHGVWHLPDARGRGARPVDRRNAVPAGTAFKAHVPGAVQHRLLGGNPRCDLTIAQRELGLAHPRGGRPPATLFRQRLNLIQYTYIDPVTAPLQRHAATSRAGA